MIERIRAGGFGLGGVLTPTGVGTLVQDGKQTVEVDGRSFLLEKPINADFAYLYANVWSVIRCTGNRTGFWRSQWYAKLSLLPGPRASAST